jgi:hypothetical protein
LILFIPISCTYSAIRTALALDQGDEISKSSDHLWRKVSIVELDGKFPFQFKDEVDENHRVQPSFTTEISFARDHLRPVTWR